MAAPRDEFSDQVRHDRQTRGSVRERYHRGALAHRTDRECLERVVVAPMSAGLRLEAPAEPPSNAGASDLDLRLQRDMAGVLDLEVRLQP